MTCIGHGEDLFSFAALAGRERLLASSQGGLLPGETVADLFCGAGGWGEGARELDIRVDFAVNHDPVAIAAHEDNNPWCRHHRGDAWRVRPRAVIGDAKLGLLLASAACTTHSRARGSAPISKRVHMLGWCIARWMEEAAPRIVLIENVPEWLDWGPTIEGPDGLRRQDPARKGQHFRRWWRYCERLGYVMERRVLDAPDYGAASRRRRLFIIARRDGLPIVWPEVTHVGVPVCRGSWSGDRAGTEGGGEGVGSGCRNNAQAGDGTPGGLPPSVPGHQCEAAGGGSKKAPHRAAAECIDWSDLGTSLFERPRPLRPKTLARIAEGIRRYVLNDSAPFVLRVTHGEIFRWKVSPVGATLPTQTTRQDLAVVSPVVTAHYSERPGCSNMSRRVDDGLGTITTSNHHSIVTPLLTPTAGGQHAGVVAPLLLDYYGNSTTGHRPDEPLRAVTTLDRHGVLAVRLGWPAASVERALATAAFLRAQLGELVAIEAETGLTYLDLGGVRRYFVDILFRMLRPRELARAMGFREDYRWPATQREAVKLIGNAVAPPVARALIAAVLPRGRERERVAV